MTPSHVDLSALVGSNGRLCIDARNSCEAYGIAEALVNNNNVVIRQLYIKRWNRLPSRQTDLCRHIETFLSQTTSLEILALEDHRHDFRRWAPRCTEDYLRAKLAACSEIVSCFVLALAGNPHAPIQQVLCSRVPPSSDALDALLRAKHRQLQVVNLCHRYPLRYLPWRYQLRDGTDCQLYGNFEWLKESLLVLNALSPLTGLEMSVHGVPPVSVEPLVYSLTDMAHLKTLSIGDDHHFHAAELLRVLPTLPKLSEVSLQGLRLGNLGTMPPLELDKLVLDNCIINEVESVVAMSLKIVNLCCLKVLRPTTFQRDPFDDAEQIGLPDPRQWEFLWRRLSALLTSNLSSLTELDFELLHAGCTDVVADFIESSHVLTKLRIQYCPPIELESFARLMTAVHQSPSMKEFVLRLDPIDECWHHMCGAIFGTGQPSESMRRITAWDRQWGFNDEEANHFVRALKTSTVTANVHLEMTIWESLETIDGDFLQNATRFYPMLHRWEKAMTTNSVSDAALSWFLQHVVSQDASLLHHVLRKHPKWLFQATSG